MKHNRSITFAAMAALLLLAGTSIAQEPAVQSEPVGTTVAKATSDAGNKPYVDKASEPSTAKPETQAVGTSTDGPWSYTDDGNWHFEIRPYVWAAGLNGTLRARDTTVSVKQDFSKYFGQLDYALGMQFEAGKGKWRVILDENYINLGAEVQGPSGRVDFNVEPTLNIFEGGASYRLVAAPHKGDVSGERPPAFSAELLGGVRWINLKAGITPTGGTEVEGSTNLVGFFVGNRYKFNVSRPITLVGKWTVGTSGVGSHVAGSAAAYADVRVAKNFSVTGGYQFLDINADDANNLTGFQGQIKGFFAGVVIRR